MQHLKPKSAPARLKSKFVKNKTNAMKEIEAWIRKDESWPVPEASRMSGQLSDNVTEERMLKAKLWELSKERYKFLSQNSYEQKVFQDRQQKKAGLRRIASASCDGRHRSAHSSDPGPADGRKTSLGLVAPRSRPMNARLALLERLDPTKKRQRAKSIDVTKKESRKPENPDPSAAEKTDTKTVGSEKNGLTNTKTGGTSSDSTAQTGKDPGAARSNTPASQGGGNLSVPQIQSSVQDKFPSPTRPVGFPSTPDPNTRPMLLEATPVSRAQSQGKLSPTDAAIKVKTPSRAVSASSSASKPAFGTRNSRELKYGQRTQGLTSDPRYARLEQTLSPLVRSKTEGDITSIVNNIESLHVRPKKRPPDAKKTKIELKAFEYMKERGFVF